jgi:hypothetical protein
MHIPSKVAVLEDNSQIWDSLTQQDGHRGIGNQQRAGHGFWRKAVNKEMAKVKIAWKTHDGSMPQQAREGNVPDLIGSQEIGCHIVIDVKMDFTRKARFVLAAGGHTTMAPSSMTYSSVVSRDSIRLAFLFAALHDVDIMSCDLENA